MLNQILLVRCTRLINLRKPEKDIYFRKTGTLFIKGLNGHQKQGSQIITPRLKFSTKIQTKLMAAKGNPL
ncbi:hypothetical protein MSNKSG1_06868 [Marinobacter santoriniensis NKSG1]|uniref:Uncharacterized protein n=1 Tax=Marinobacter santoriniensis NKSG1 TaxID=1288826 RepID=M7D4A6_9GAMM|nr:hypothetical protein MSNKSG1_06868 [Marinobacter santoriniensis NKSG1]